MTTIPFLGADDRAVLDRLLTVEPEDLSRAFVTFARTLGKDLAKDYRGADLRGYNLFGQDLGGVDLTGADLRGADLRKVKNLDFDDILSEGARIDGSEATAPSDPLHHWTTRWIVLDERERWVEIESEATNLLSKDWGPSAAKDEVLIRSWRAVSLTRLGRSIEALDEYDLGLAIQTDYFGATALDTLEIRNSRAIVLRILGRSGKALAEFNSVLNGLRTYPRYVDRQVLQTRRNRTAALAELDRLEEAERELRAILEQIDRSENALADEQPMTQLTLAEVLLRANRPQEARDLLQRAVEEWAPRKKSGDAYLQRARELLAETRSGAPEPSA